MILVHRLTQPDRPMYLNSDQIQAIEATPDTVVTLENGQKLIVAETPDEIVERVWTWRSSLLNQTLSVQTAAEATRASKSVARSRPGSKAAAR